MIIITIYSCSTYIRSLNLYYYPSFLVYEIKLEIWIFISYSQKGKKKQS